MLFWLVNSIFILFAVLNIDDPDWFLWVPTYLLVVAGAVSYEKKLINKKGEGMQKLTHPKLRHANAKKRKAKTCKR